MRHYAKIFSQFWIGETGRKIKGQGAEAALLAFYLMTSPHANMIGVYYLPCVWMVYDTSLSEEGVFKALEALCDIYFCSYDFEKQYVWVHKMGFYQVDKRLKLTDHRVKNVNKLYHALPSLTFLEDFYRAYQEAFFLEKRIFSQGALKALRSQEQKQEQEQEQKQEQDFEEIPNGISLSSSHSTFDFKKTEQGSQKDLSIELEEEAKEVLVFLNQRAHRAFRAVESNLKLIKARLKSGITVTQCRQVIVKKVREWKDNPHMQAYLRPATLFNATKFEQYVGELVLPKEEKP